MSTSSYSNNFFSCCFIVLLFLPPPLFFSWHMMLLGKPFNGRSLVVRNASEGAGNSAGNSKHLCFSRFIPHTFWFLTNPPFPVFSARFLQPIFQINPRATRRLKRMIMPLPIASLANVSHFRSAPTAFWCRRRSFALRLCALSSS